MEVQGPARCGWCGRFLRRGTEPIDGFNVKLERISQTLCPECGPQWTDLSKRNVERVDRFSQKTYERKP
jgi:hypothetical protein